MVSIPYFNEALKPIYTFGITLNLYISNNFKSSV